jgi:aspartyl-tRNA(Asn)/glutamyl-tRNA(Gln) amidotransferase subunit A
MMLSLAARLRAGETSSAALVEESLSRIEELNPRLNAFITVMGGPARARAAALDAELASGYDRGPLHGIPVAVKDLFFTRGVRTTAGSLLFKDFIPGHDADVVARLEEAGAVIVGKTGLHECAYGITSNNPHYGAVRNPHDPERIPGGSSGGSGAAVAAGIVPMAMGTDTGGSIRIPASFCGCAGLKPTYGRVSRRGVFPLGFTLDHMGPLARTVADCALTMNAIAGMSLPPYARDIRGLRIGRPENFYFERTDPRVIAAIDAALKRAESLGAIVLPIRVPDVDELNAVARVLLLAEASAALEPHWAKRDQFGADVLALIDQGRLIPATDYVQAQRLRKTFLAAFDRLWAQVECWVTPSTPAAAPKIGQMTIDIGGVEEDVRLATTRTMRGINVLGYPALSIPCGRDALGLPLGMQIVGPAWREDVVLRAGTAMEPPAA